MNYSFETLSNETQWSNDTATPLSSDPTPTQDVLACVIVIFGLMIAACCFVVAIIAAVRSEQDVSSDRVNDYSTSDQNFQERLERVKRCIVVRYWTTEESNTSTDSTEHKGDTAHHGNATAAAAAHIDTTEVDLEQQQEEELRHDTSTTTTLSSDDDLESVNDGTLCAICLNQFQDHEVVCESKNTACCHVFHLTCMSLWLRKHSSCPVCRKEYLCTTGSDRSDGHQQEIAIWVNGSIGSSNFGLF
jgi:Ring finger domain